MARRCSSPTSRQAACCAMTRRPVHAPCSVNTPTTLIAATPKFEAKRRGASDHSDNCMVVASGGYCASNFAGSAIHLLLHWTRLLWLNGFNDLLELIVAH